MNIYFFRFLLFLFLFFTHPTYAANATELYPFTSTEASERFEKLIKTIRCVVCQNQSLADSNAPLAADLRQKIYEMVLEKKSNLEIESYLVKRYGEFILLRPQINKSTIFLWIFPIILLLAAFLFLVNLNRNRQEVH